MINIMADLIDVLNSASKLDVKIDYGALRIVAKEAEALAKEACMGVDDVDCEKLMAETFRRAGAGPVDHNYWRYVAYVELMLAPNPMAVPKLLAIWSNAIKAATQLDCRAAAELGKAAATSIMIAMNIYMAAFSNLMGTNWELMDSLVKTAINQLIV